MGEEEAKGGPVNPESVLKKQKSSKEWTLKKNAENRKLIYSRAKQYAKEYEEQQKELIQLKPEAKLKGGFYVDPEPVHSGTFSINAMHPKTRKILQLLRLRQIFNGVFLKVNKATMNMLHRVPQFEECVRTDLQEGLRKVEQALGKFGIIWMEDLIHEIMTVGPHFKEANNFLWPFKLKAPFGGLKKKRNHYVEGGDAGNRENYINELIRRMN
ncbi:hypothetical protein PVL29_012191 [Vitis rotundifolia]|uniref:Uncharacterized protein n=1 Tax=Vitis rotundifolia TaxID=103349 RepID=A0AA39DQE0_VITRO|nr:hypothetical protein PVL29_012191 [Vitis rotundifolia]